MSNPIAIIGTIIALIAVYIALRQNVLNLAFSGTFLGLRLVPPKWRYLVPPQAAKASC